MERLQLPRPVLGIFLPLVLGPIVCLALAGCGPEKTHPESHPEHSQASSGEAPLDHEEHEEGVLTLSAEKLAAVDLVAATAQLRPLNPQLETTGEVDYEQDRLAHVSPRIPGRVARVNARLGERVRAGQALAVIDSIELGEAKVRYLAARSRTDLAQENFDREEALYGDGITSQRDLLEHKTELVQARATSQGARETLRLYGLTEEQIAALEAGDSGAALLSVRAPIGGRVVKKHVTVGELVMPEKNLFTIADLSRVWVWIDVFERDMALVHEGDAVEVRVDAFPDRDFHGEVVYIGAEVAPDTRTVRARIDVPNPERLLRPGMFAAVRLTDPHGGSLQTPAPEALVVPAAAVVRDGERTLVFSPLGDTTSGSRGDARKVSRFRALPVQTGRRQGEWVEVLAGLEAGDAVITEGTFVLKSELAREDLGGGHSH
ncbi:MAG: efflux RND transporter periplasmic adaptor subunit [Acidobacteriota bacterium]|nr:efflux RND transporter periplasmic adaptor subunit [Acidobacteriota bacterium]